MPKSKFQLSVSEITYEPHPTIDVVHPDGWTQIFGGLYAVIYRQMEITEGQAAALNLARTTLAPFAVDEYFPTKGHQRTRVKEGV